MGYTVVAGVDYSAASDEALSQALESALRHEPAELHVVHVLKEPQVVVPAEMSQVPLVPEAELLKAEGERLHEYLRVRLDVSAEAGSWLAITSHVLFGDAALELSQLASDVGASVVVVGTQRRGGSERWLMGSVAEQVVRHAPCPVLVVRHEAESASPALAPPCVDCERIRAETSGRDIWCEAHTTRRGESRRYQLRVTGSPGQRPVASVL